MRIGLLTLASLVLPLTATNCGGSSGAASGCALSTMTCGSILPESDLMTLQPLVTSYNTLDMLPCQFGLESGAGGILQAFCGDADLLARQITTTMAAYPTATFTETDTVGMKSWEIMVGEPMQRGSFAEIGALTTNGQYVFNVSMESAASDIAAVRQIAAVINTHLSAH